MAWGEASFHHAPSLWSQQLISNGLASLGLLSGLVLRPRIWPRCDYPLGKRTTQDRRRRSSAPAIETVGSLFGGCQKFCARFPPRPVTTIIMWNVCLSKGNGVTRRHIVRFPCSGEEQKYVGRPKSSSEWIFPNTGCLFQYKFHSLLFITHIYVRPTYLDNLGSL